jgi:dTDP-3-amino-3,4,6-trideoxy-alpha-D-glucose transaminase
LKVPYLDVRAANFELRAQLSAAFERVNDSGNYILGDEVRRFESEFGRFCGTKDAVGVGNGLDALTIALRACGVNPGDEVIVPAHTFIATWLAVTACGATVVPVDVDWDRLLIDLEAAEAVCTSRTTAIVPVFINGHPMDANDLERFATRQGLRVLCDAAQAHGARTLTRSVGAVGDAAAFSFYPAKNLGALGDGGAITTNDEEIAVSARQLRDYGRSSKYEFARLGVNSRLDELQAALLRVKLAVLDEWNARRARVAKRYLDELSTLSAITLPPQSSADMDPAWYVFCIRHPQRNLLMSYLTAKGIETQINYPEPPHLSAAYSYLGFSAGAFPNSERAALTGLNLPIGPHLSDEAVSYVIDAVREFCAEAQRE